ncbi:hypothetical protein EDD36DRAFT_255492 [Exophiala viscosa]|uniref:BZIP domain-containing protein n=1 Tax=Exophiala viscosa TaxID=2486360 RepID=A0AAN6DVZ2_9EURO|nr:hypothetical protein EDD36DRAFT_255492 [Exophiala viscosa]
MGSGTFLPAPNCQDEYRDKEQPKPAITEARKEQNRRAQRAFRERRRLRKRIMPDTAPRRLAPFPPEVEADAMVRSHDTQVLDWTQKYTADEEMFTFSSPQNLFPTEECMSKPCTPFTQFLTLVRERPRCALWPHGATATLAACLFNARVLGIDIERVMDPQYMSPFYRPPLPLALREGPPSAAPLTNLDIASESRLPPLGPLKPCLAQISFPHHACLDLLPLPQLRDMAVMLTVRAQQEQAGAKSSLLDGVQELKKDVYVRQGVRFRGAGELRRDEKITSDESERHCGHPWERASWAVAPWFARKWKHVMDV